MDANNFIFCIKINWISNVWSRGMRKWVYGVFDFTLTFEKAVPLADLVRLVV